MYRFNSLSELAEGLNNCTDSTHFKVWEKAGKQRICISHLGHNTKKMSTKVWMEFTDKITSVCVIECPSQPRTWIESQQAEILAYAERYVRYARRFFPLPMATLPVKEVMHNALLDAEEVQGYTLQWHNVRIAINGYGKLANRNRQFVVPFEGTKNNAPRDFVQLTPLGFALLKQRAMETSGVYGDMLEPYNSPIDYDSFAQQIAQRNNKA